MSQPRMEAPAPNEPGGQLPISKPAGPGHLLASGDAGDAGYHGDVVAVVEVAERGREHRVRDAEPGRVVLDGHGPRAHRQERRARAGLAVDSLVGAAPDERFPRRE